MGLLFIITLICIVHGTISWTDNTVRRFKDEFLFGAATASYQVEGAWDVDGKSESIWDNFLHKNPDILPDGRNGDVAANSYEFYKRDVEMLRELGVDYYRFSTSWPRVLPTGFPNEKNEKGLQYYDNLIDELLKYNIEPMVTLYHWDLPQRLQDLGGWANPLIIDWFVDYAKVMFDRYGDRVKYWLTINQPNSVCMESYGDSIFAPAIYMKGIADYMCMKHIMLAHAKVYRLYEAVYKKKYGGSVGIAISANWVDPINNKTENVQAAEEYRQYLFGLFINPIYSKEGGFPRAVVDIVAKKSRDEGYTRSRLPELSSQEKALIRGSSDFLGINHYTTVLATRGKSDFDIDVTLTQSEQWGKSQSRWLRSAPYGLYKLLLYINKHYNYPPIIITENGFSTGLGVLDEARVEYMNNYLAALLLAIEDGTNVRGYTAWSLLDNVEWVMGTSERFGLYEVDFDAEDKKRTARLSALVYKNIINTRKIDKDFAPKDLKIKLSKRRTNKMKQEL